MFHQQNMNQQNSNQQNRNHDMTILAIDLGKANSAWCLYHAGGDGHRFGTVKTTRQQMHDLLVELRPDRLVIEIGCSAGWVHDLATALGIQVQVANTNHEAWRWKNVKRKTDRDDALKLAQLSAMNQLPTVHMPRREVRAWRSLIAYRRSLVDRRTAIRNNVRAILQREAIEHPRGKKGWSLKAQATLENLASFDADELWRFELGVELRLHAALEAQIAMVEKKLLAIASRDDRVKRLKSAPCVGDRVAETIVAVIDDPHRFRRGREVGCYIGLTPRKFQSGAMDRDGGISGEGHALLRSLLVEVSWLGVGRWKVPWMVNLFERICRGSKHRRKIAIVAVARHLLIRCWAMLRDESAWREPSEGEVLKMAA